MSLQLIISVCLSVCVFTIKMHNSNIYLQYKEKRFVHVLMEKKNLTFITTHFQMCQITQKTSSQMKTRIY